MAIKSLKRFIASFSLFLLCSFSTLLAGWSPLPGITISNTAPDIASDEPQIGMDSLGNATAIWREYDSTNNITRIRFAILPRGGASWSSPGTIFAMSGSFSAFPQIAVTPSGYTIAVWQAVKGTNSIVLSATRSHFTGSWVTPLMISLPTLSPDQFPQVSIDPNGNAVAVWVRNDGNHDIVQAGRLPFKASSWTNITDLSDTAKDAQNPQIGLDASGNGVAVWIQATDAIIQSRTFSGGTWVSTTNTLSDPVSDVPQLSVNPSGVAVAIWNRIVGTSFFIEASRFIGGSWSSPEDISTPGSSPGFAALFAYAVAVDLSGNALAVWSEFFNHQFFLESAYLPIESTSWSIPIVIAPPNVISETDSRVAFDASGNATAVWASRSSFTTFIIQAAMLPLGTNQWINLTNLSTEGELSELPQIAIDPSGYTVVDWQNDTLQTVQATVNTAPPLPPSNFVGVIKKNKFLNKTECVLQATWEASPSSVVAYQIYKDGKVVDTILATAPFFFRTCLRDCLAEGYEIAAVSLDNLVSNRVKGRIVREEKHH